MTMTMTTQEFSGGDGDDDTAIHRWTTTTQQLTTSDNDIAINRQRQIYSNQPAATTKQQSTGSDN
jgi:hypothetical protein